MKIVRFCLTVLLSFNICTYSKSVYANDIDNKIVNVNAYNLYKKGLEFYLLHTIKDYKDSIDLFNKALEINPNSPEILSAKSLSQSFLAYRIRDDKLNSSELFNEAKNNAEKAISLNNNLSDAYISLSAYYKFNFNFFKALEYAKISLSLSPNNPEAYFWIWYSSNVQNPEDPNIKKTILLNPRMLFAHSELGNAYLIYQKYDEALLEYQKALKINPYYIYAYNNIASAYGEKKEYEKALTYYKKAFETLTSDVDIIDNLYHIYSIQKNKKLIINEKKYILNVLKNGVINNPNSSTIMAKLDEILYSEDIEYTVAFYKEILEKNKNTKIYKIIADIYLKKRNFKKALIYYKKAKEFDKTNDEILNNLAFIYYYFQDYISFINTLKEIQIETNLIDDIQNIQNVFKKPLIHIKIGDFFTKNNLPNLNFSILAYKRSLNFNDKDPEVYEKLGNILDSYYLYVQETDLNKIFTENPLDYFKKAYMSDPKNVKYILLLADKYRNYKEYTKASNMYKKILEIEPNNIHALYELSEIYSMRLFNLFFSLKKVVIKCIKILLQPSETDRYDSRKNI
ncbi:MAG: tetratricopeptide repeat protein [Candidatus Sericytochromatia bacterium]